MSGMLKLQVSNRLLGKVCVRVGLNSRQSSAFKELINQNGNSEKLTCVALMENTKRIQRDERSSLTEAIGEGYWSW